MFSLSPEPAQYVPVQRAQYISVEMTDLSAANVEIIAPVAPEAYHLPPTLRLSRVLGFSFFGLGQMSHTYTFKPVAPAAAAVAVFRSDDAV